MFFKRTSLKYVVSDKEQESIKHWLMLFVGVDMVIRRRETVFLHTVVQEWQES